MSAPHNTSSLFPAQQTTKSQFQYWTSSHPSSNSSESFKLNFFRICLITDTARGRSEFFIAVSNRSFLYNIIFKRKHEPFRVYWFRFTSNLHFTATTEFGIWHHSQTSVSIIHVAVVEDLGDVLVLDPKWKSFTSGLLAYYRIPKGFWRGRQKELLTTVFFQWVVP